MTRDIDELVRQLTLDEKASLTAGADNWSTVAIDRVELPKVFVTDGPNGARGPTLPGLGDEGTTTAVCVPCGAALGATWDVELLGRVGGAARRPGPHQGLPRAAGADREPPPVAARRAQLRVVLRGSAAGRPAGGRVRARRPEPGRGHHGEALRRQRVRDRAHVGQLDRRRAHLAGAVPAALRAGRARRRFARDHDRLQPAQRHLRSGQRRPARGDPAGGVGVRGLRGHRLVRAGRHRRGRRGRSRPGDARTAPLLRREAGRGGAGRHHRRIADRRGGDTAAARVRPPRRPRRPTRRTRLGRPARGSRAGARRPPPPPSCC